MRFAMLIDYANTFHNIKKNNKLTQNVHQAVEEEVERIVQAAKQYVEKQNMTLVKTIAIVLHPAGLGKPEKRFKEHNIDVMMVQNTGKTSRMEKMNQSRPDDAKLIELGGEMIKNDEADGIIVVSNDQDFASLGRTVRQMGGLFWVGIHEGKKQRTSTELKHAAQKLLRLHELVKGVDEGIPLPQDHEAVSEQTKPIKGPHFALFQNGEIIMRYPINRIITEIGRRSTKLLHHPEIDLTDFDEHRYLSRKHAYVESVLLTYGKTDSGFFLVNRFS
jgi:uncharacterized LabA/DUF88 family protein